VAPISTFSQFGSSAPEFSVLTDASAVGFGVVLEQNNHGIAYASSAPLLRKTIVLFNVNAL